MSTTEQGSQDRSGDEPEGNEGAQHQQVEAEARRRAGNADGESPDEGRDASAADGGGTEASQSERSSLNLNLNQSLNQSRTQPRLPRLRGRHRLPPRR